MKYFNLRSPDSERLWADHNKGCRASVKTPCPVTKEHHRLGGNIGDLYLEVKHNRRDELMVWAWSVGVHERILEGFEREGFTGYRVKPALVRFRDGSTSNEYHELIVTGWAGAVSPESGMKLIKSCPGCHHREFSPIINYDKMIDWNQWNGEDLFLVYPLHRYRLCTERVAAWLRANKVKSFCLEEGFSRRANDSIISKMGTVVGELYESLPDDVANVYSKSLGLE